ncbi:BTB/POZ/MATH-domain protein [Rhynchospora pubera]|uniref:BTB/POZ/MATH-domain protein n=1 Tax=Rhynchospora pubera TaxID=906938 RepID=A0AAV8FA30_9POAL|nr:BTB/POZ/MATH-domain protein [Rhynchospora pubera]
MAPPSLESQSLAAIKSLAHHIEIEFNYSKSKHLPVGQYISSPPFSVKGYEWALHFYPQGNSLAKSNGTHVSLFLKYLSNIKEVQAEFSLNILHKNGEHFSTRNPLVYNNTFKCHPSSDDWGTSKFIPRVELENLFCKDGLVIISCKIMVVSAPAGVDDSTNGLCHDIEKLWGRGERFDVTFEVEEERIYAHKFMLAARSPVFEAELYGSMKEAKSSNIKIKDIKAEVFKALLRFIYTDKFDDGELKRGLSDELVQDLFAAADRYALEKLKMQCEKRLHVYLSIDTVLTTLTLAEQHNSAWLKEKCLQFASNSKNFTQLALTEEYVQMMQVFPSLLVELRQKVKDSSN